MTRTSGPHVPREWADLDVVEELGRGAESVVYRVRRGDGEYAYKLLLAAGSEAETARALAAFRREAALLACVDHPLLPRIFEVGRADGRPYLVLELIEGQPLSDVLRAGPMTPGQVVRLGIDAAGSLAAAHQAGLVHRDVKPDNIMVTADGVTRVIDFGLATRGGTRDEGLVAGTAVYSAPEQTGMLKRAVDGRADLYALGVVMYECATGRPPFAAADVGELIRLHAAAPAPDPRELRADLPAGLAAVILRLLAKDPDDRYPSGRSLLADLARLAAPGPAADRPDQPDERRPGPDDGVLVGRAEELGRLANRWRRARAGHGGMALVQGVPGTGKSRLVRELTAEAGHDLVLYGKCEPDDPVPLAPLRAALDAHLTAAERLPAAERVAVHDRLRQAAGSRGALLKALSPLLADVLQAPDLGEDNRHEQFASAVAAFLAELATLAGGAILHVDDVQWLDGATGRVLDQLAGQLAATPLLLVATARDDADSQDAPAAFRTRFGTAVDTHVTLGPLDDAAVADLVAHQLGGGVVAAELTAQLATRTGGNPFTVLEYVRAVVDAGLVTPSWGTWRLDVDGLDRLELSGDALDLVLKRLDGLGGDSRRLLVAAAAMGMRFRPELVGRVCGVEPAAALDAMTDAAGHRLVAATGGGRYGFLHDRIREALLASLPPARLRALHQRIATVLDRSLDSLDPQQVYAVARHYARGETDRTPDRAFARGLEAGRLALADHAPAAALDFLAQAAAVGAAAGIAPGADFAQAMGLACMRTGRFAEAVEQFEAARRLDPDPVGRAALQALIARVHLSAWDPELSLAAVRTGLDELGCPLPRRRFALVATTLLSFLAGLLVGATKVRFGTATGAERERLRLEATLYDIGGYASTMSMRLQLRAILAFRSLYLINRLGPGTEYARHLAGFGMVASLLGRARLAERLFTRSDRVAEALGDPSLVAHVQWKRGAGTFLGGADEGEAWRRVLQDHARWLDLGDYLTGVALHCVVLVLRGRTREAQLWYDRGRERMATGALAEGAAITVVSAVVPAQFGRPAESGEPVAKLRTFLAANPGNTTQQANLSLARLVVGVEEGEVGAPFDEVVREFEATGITPKELVGEQRMLYLFLALGRLAQTRQAPAEQRAARLRETDEALRLLALAASTAILRTYHQVCHADLAQLRGDAAGALKLLDRAADGIARADAPLLEYEAARVRARAYRTLGRDAQAERQARYALLLAGQEGWAYRARWVRTEFGIGATAADTPGQSQPAGPAGGAAVLHRRRLDALQQVSLAAATILDPRELARVALDETVRILGAERAYLFLADPGTGQLVPHLGRDEQGADVEELTGYGSTLVERVRSSGEPLVVTGSQEGAALGSRSALVHGLRSIMIAPLQLDGRLLGVVYLDSRVAKGIFTTEDVDILMAITNVVAVSLETARAAQLELTVRAAQQQLDVAETLRAATTRLGATLDPDEVVERLLGTVLQVLPGESAALVRRDADRLVLAAAQGPARLVAAVGTDLDPAADPVLAELLERTEPSSAPVRPSRPAPLRGLLGPAGSWLALPVAERGTPLGVLLVGCACDEVPAAQARIAAALVGPGMIAYENARLFSQVRRMATVDGLTGLYNRNHFFERAGRQVGLARRHGRPVAALMVDIDHFKQINDTHGHPVGDDVIRGVAARIAAALRESDVVGRYGGEEFALVTPETGEAAAALGERLRAAVGTSPLPTRAGPLPVTISVGVAHDPAGGSDLGALLASADTALYTAKNGGRDRVAVAP